MSLRVALLLRLLCGGEALFPLCAHLSRRGATIRSSELTPEPTPQPLIHEEIDAPESGCDPEPTFDIASLPGVLPPLGFFDPLGFSEGISEGRGEHSSRL